MRRSWLRRNRLITTLPVLSTRSGGLFSAMEKSASVADASVTTHFLGEASERRPWAFNRDDRPAIVAGRSELSLRVPRDTGRAYTSKYPIPLPAGTRFRHRKTTRKISRKLPRECPGKRLWFVTTGCLKSALRRSASSIERNARIPASRIPTSSPSTCA